LSTPADEQELERALAEAVRLFNAGEYHAAHELLDGLWESTHGPDADFFKGLIQAAIAMHHFSRANLDGAKKLYSGHRRYLAAYLPAHRGLDTAAFLAEMQRVLQPVSRARPGESIAFDREHRPKLRAVERPA
jgi:uncharacterized protein